MIRSIVLGLALAGMASAGMSSAAWATGDAKAGAVRIKAAGCITCHGRDGVSKLPEAPNLAGQVEMYLSSALVAYKTGARKNEMMNAMAEGLSDTDIADISAYYNSIQVSVTPPPKP